MRNRTNLLFPDRKKAFEFGAFMLERGPGDRTGNQLRQQLKSLGIVSKYQSEGSNTGGGFAVPKEVASDIEDTLNTVSVFRANARVRQLSSDTLEVAKRATQIVPTFTAENLAASETEGTWTKYMLIPQKAMTLLRGSTELINEDSVADYGQYIASEFVTAFGLVEDDCGFNGDGTAAYGGMTGITKRIIDGTHTASAITAAAGHDLFSEIDATDLGTLMQALPERWWPTAKFYCSTYAMVNTFIRLGATAGGLIDTGSGPRAQLHYMGIPIVLTPKMPGSGSQTGKAMILFGDLFASSTIGVRRDMRVQILQERYVDLDQVGILGSHRFNIVNHELGDNTNAGPIVALVGA